MALEEKTAYLCQKSVITMNNQVQLVCSPKDKIWFVDGQTSKMPLTTSGAGQIETN